MKIQELLLEIREILDRNEYGYWIDSNTNKPYRVPVYGHEPFVQKNRKKLLNRISDKSFDDFDPYAIAYASGMVKVLFDNQNFAVSGLEDNIKKISSIIIPSIIVHFKEYPTGRFTIESFPNVDSLKTWSPRPNTKIFNGIAQAQEAVQAIKGISYTNVAA